MLTKEENELMCRVEGDAPMGQVMRRHWIPACLSEEVLEPDGKPGTSGTYSGNLALGRILPDSVIAGIGAF